MSTKLLVGLSALAADPATLPSRTSCQSSSSEILQTVLFERIAIMF